MSNEQWKEEGNCKKCRRADYCGKPCKAAKELDEEVEAFLEEACPKMMEKHYPKKK